MSKINLTRSQKEAVEHGTGPLLIIAGAGTGKTTVITERIKFLISEKGVKPDEVLALTFTEKAANEMEERVDKALPYGYTQMWISTFHSFCEMILKDEAINIGLNPNFKLLNEAQSIILLRKNIFNLNLKYFRPLGNPNKFLDALLQHFSRLKDEDITPQEYLKFSKKIPEEEERKKTMELSTVYQQYEDIKIKEGFMDFSDLISNTLLLFRKRPEILKKYQDKFKYILLDEFQDTNYAQNELGILIAGNKENLTVVADDDQAIYRWRGAALSNVIQFKKNFPSAKIVTLKENFRSTQEILDRSYSLIQNNNPNRLEVLEKIDKKLISTRKKKGKKIEFIKASRVEEETELIAKKIKELVEKDGIKYKDVAILVRANNHSLPITAALHRFGVPYQFLGPGQLFQQEEIKDLIAYMKVLCNLNDSISLFRVLNIDIFQLEPRDINYLISFAKRKNINLFEALNKNGEIQLQDESKEKFKKIHYMILKHLSNIKKESGGQILYDFLVDSGLYVKFLEATNQKEEKITQNIARFFDKIKNFESVNEDSNIYAVLDWIELTREMGDSPLAAEIDWKIYNAVNILTVHSSKGLEFPVVFLVNLVVDRFPTRERREKIPIPNDLIKEVLSKGDYHLQEERRLFYVAMTRAKDKLFFTASGFYGDGKRARKPSPFIVEADPHLQLQSDDEKEVKQLSLLELTQGYENSRNSEEKPLSHIGVNFISYSQLQTFDICPLHYKAKFILGLPTEPSAAQSFGITIHKVLKDIYEQAKKKEITKDDVSNILKENWISEGYIGKAHEENNYLRAQNTLTDFLKNSFDSKKLPLATELPFSFYLNRNDSYLRRDESASLKISGKIDRIDKTSEGLEIIDYKTGEKGISKSAYDFQLGLYALAASKVQDPRLKNNTKDLVLKLLFVETGEVFSRKITKDEILEVEKKIIEKVKLIEESDFKCSQSVLCSNCEFKILCNVN